MIFFLSRRNFSPTRTLTAVVYFAFLLRAGSLPRRRLACPSPLTVRVVDPKISISARLTSARRSLRRSPFHSSSALFSNRRRFRTPYVTVGTRRTVLRWRAIVEPQRRTMKTWKNTYLLSSELTSTVYDYDRASMSNALYYSVCRKRPNPARPSRRSPNDLK